MCSICGGGECNDHAMQWVVCCLNPLLSLQSTKDFLGMVVRQGQLYCIYKLNGIEYKIKTRTINQSASEPAMFDKVELRR